MQEEPILEEVILDNHTQEYRKHEYVELADALYFCKHRQKSLELELDQKEFRCKCMPQTKGYYSDQIDKDLPVLICAGLIVLVAFYIAGSFFFDLAVGGIKNVSPGSAILLMVMSWPGAKYGIQCYDIIKNFLKCKNIQQDLEEEEQELRARIYDIKLELEQLREERAELEREVKLQDRIIEIERKLSH